MLKLLKLIAPGIVGLALLAAPASADVLEVGDDGVVRTRTDTPGAGWQTAEQKAAAEERKALLMEAALSAPTLGAPTPVVLGSAPIPAQAVLPLVTADHLRHVPPTMIGAVMAAAEKYGLSPLLIDAVARQESGYRANVVSRVGAVGVMQLMPGTARMMGVRNPRDPHANIDGGARYLRQLLDRFGGNIALALAAYNAGPARVERAGGVPRIAETQNYVSRILARLATGAAAATQAVAQIASSTGE